MSETCNRPIETVDSREIVLRACGRRKAHGGPCRVSVSDADERITTLTRERDEARWAHRDAREDYERLCKERDEARSKVRRLLHVIHGMAEAAGMPEPALAPEGEILRGIQHLRTDAARLRGALETCIAALELLATNERGEERSTPFGALGKGRAALAGEGEVGDPAALHLNRKPGKTTISDAAKKIGKQVARGMCRDGEPVSLHEDQLADICANAAALGLAERLFGAEAGEEEGEASTTPEKARQA